MTTTLQSSAPPIGSVEDAFTLINEAKNRYSNVVVQRYQNLIEYRKESRRIAESLAKYGVKAHDLAPDDLLGVAFKAEDLQKVLKDHSGNTKVYRDVVRAMQVPFLAMTEFLNLLCKTDPNKTRIGVTDDTLDIGEHLRLNFEPRGEAAAPVNLMSFTVKGLEDASSIVYHLKPDHFADAGPTVNHLETPNPYGWRRDARIKSIDISDYRLSDNVRFQSKITLDMGIGENRTNVEPAMMSKVYFNAPDMQVYTSSDYREDTQSTERVFRELRNTQIV